MEHNGYPAEHNGYPGLSGVGARDTCVSKKQINNKKHKHNKNTE